MSRTIQIVNEYPGILDLSVIKDVVNIPVVLQPKGHGGASRECFAEAADHPSVLAMKKAGRVSVREDATTAAPVVAAPAPAPMPVEAAPAPVPAPEPEALPPAPEPIPEAASLEAAPEPAMAVEEPADAPAEDGPAPSFEARKGSKPRRG